MIVVVDAGLLPRSQHDEKVKYLLELLAEEPVQAHLYSYHGHPDHAQAVVAVDTGVEGIRGWVVTRPSENGEKLDAIYLKDGVPTRVPTESNDRSFLHMSETGPPTEVPSDDLLAQVRIDAFGMLVSKALRADLFITDHRLLVDSESGFWRGMTVMEPEAALPVVGLYLRQQEKFLLYRTPALGMRNSPVRHVQRDRMWFYWEVAQGLLPARDRWEFACKGYTDADGEKTLTSLPTALTWRLNQALRSRDRLLATLALVPQDHSTVDEALTELDQILLWIMAGFDITAQVAHIALDIQMKKGYPAWQNDQWLDKVASDDEQLAELVRNGNEGQHILTIVRLLRNSVHGDALSAGGMIPVVGEHALEPLLALPLSVRAQVLGAIDALGDRDAWGVSQPFLEEDLHLHPGAFVEQLLPRTLQILNALMAATPVERLLSADSDPARLSGEFPRMLPHHRIMWQLGLESEVAADITWVE